MTWRLARCLASAGATPTPGEGEGHGEGHGEADSDDKPEHTAEPLAAFALAEPVGPGVERGQHTLEVREQEPFAASWAHELELDGLSLERDLHT